MQNRHIFYGFRSFWVRSSSFMIDYLTQIFYFVHTKFALFKSDLKSVFLNSFKNFSDMTFVFLEIFALYHLSMPLHIPDQKTLYPWFAEIDLVLPSDRKATVLVDINLYVCEWLDTLYILLQLWLADKLLINQFSRRLCLHSILKIFPPVWEVDMCDPLDIHSVRLRNPRRPISCFSFSHRL